MTLSERKEASIVHLLPCTSKHSRFCSTSLHARFKHAFKTAVLWTEHGLCHSIGAWCYVSLQQGHADRSCATTHVPV